VQNEAEVRFIIAILIALLTPDHKRVEWIPLASAILCHQTSNGFSDTHPNMHLVSTIALTAPGGIKRTSVVYASTDV
jgi:hypothetical protein